MLFYKGTCMKARKEALLNMKFTKYFFLNPELTRFWANSLVPSQGQSFFSPKFCSAFPHFPCGMKNKMYYWSRIIQHFEKCLQIMTCVLEFYKTCNVSYVTGVALIYFSFSRWKLVAYKSENIKILNVFDTMLQFVLIFHFVSGKIMGYPTKMTDWGVLDSRNQVQSKSNVPQFCLSYISPIYGPISIKFRSQQSLRPATTKNRASTLKMSRSLFTLIISQLPYDGL